MVIKIQFLLIFILVFLLGLILVNGQSLICDVRDKEGLTPCTPSKNEQIIFKMSDIENGNAELENQNFYNYEVCCTYTGKGNLDNKCSGQFSKTVLRLSSTTNAHVEIEPSPFPLDPYLEEACIRSTDPKTDLSFFTQQLKQLGVAIEDEKVIDIKKSRCTYFQV